MQKKTLSIIAVVVIIIAAGVTYAMMHKSSGSNANNPYSSSSSNSSNASSSSSSSSSSQTSGAIIQTKTDATVGKYLADSSGNALYTYGADTAGVSNCSGSCIYSWPIYDATSAATSLPANVTVITRSDGGKQYAYKGMPLYNFSSDSAGQVTGDNVNNFHVAKP